jgi:hypothetical protein
VIEDRLQEPQSFDFPLDLLDRRGGRAVPAAGRHPVSGDSPVMGSRRCADPLPVLLRLGARVDVLVDVPPNHGQQAQAVGAAALPDRHLQVPALGADARAENPGLRLFGPHTGQRCGVGGAYDEGDSVRFAGPASDLPSHLEKQRPSRGQPEGLQVPRFGIRSPAEQEQPPARVGEKGGQGLRAEVRVEGDRIHAPLFEHRPRVGHRRLTDVVALGVEDHRDFWRNHGQRLTQGLEARQTVRLVESDVGLVTGDVRGRGVNDRAVALLHLLRCGQTPGSLGPRVQADT